jgi:CheY-like chemotaxis protein
VAAPVAEPDSAANPHAPERTRRIALVIEDDKRAADLLRLHLESDGFQVVCVSQPSDAMEEARRLRPVVITLDLCFPESSGWLTLEAIKGDSELKDIPVVVVSIIADEHKGLALGAAKILQKPVTRETLLAAVNGLGTARRNERKFNVLIIDDEPQAVDLVSATLQSLNCRFARAYDGQSAVRMVEQNPPDLIILDLMMPGVDGFEVIDMLQQRHSHLLLPILVLTAKSVTRQDRERLHGRVLNIMEKSSFQRSDFLAEVKRALQTAGA